MRICIVLSIDPVEETSLFTPPDNLNGRRPRRPMGSAEDGAGEGWWNEHYVQSDRWSLELCSWTDQTLLSIREETVLRSVQYVSKQVFP